MLKIQVIKTSKDKILQPHLAAAGHIPAINTSTILSGRSGSGKSMVLANLLTRNEFLGCAFDEMYLISPTGLSDDIQKSLKIPLKNVYVDVMEGIEEIGRIMEIQRDVIELVGADKAPKICIVFDDCVSERKLMNHKTFISCFIASRHYNFTVFLNTQSWTACPRRCRLQANGVIMFGGDTSELELLSQSHTPCGMNKKEFVSMVADITREAYAFLYINLKNPLKTRYRKNFEHIITI